MKQGHQFSGPPVMRLTSADKKRLAAVRNRVDDAIHKWYSRSTALTRCAPSLTNLDGFWKWAATHYIDVASDHLLAIMALMSAQPLPNAAMFTLARAAFEAASLALWVADPDITAIERQQRGIQLHSDWLHRNQKTAGDRGRVKELQAAATKVSLSLDRKRPSFSELAKKATKNDKNVYHLLSLYAHGNPSAIGSRSSKATEGVRARVLNVELFVCLLDRFVLDVYMRAVSSV